MTTAVDLTKPALGDAYASFQSEIVAGLQAAGAMYDTTYWTTTSQPAGTKRFNASSSLLESWNGSAWVNALAVLQTGNTGTQTVVGTVNYSGTLQLGGNLVATQAWVTSQSYETTSALSATLANYALTSALSSYVLTSALASASVASATTAGTATTVNGSIANGTTATTQASGNSSTLPATTAFVNPGTSKAASGYRKFPDGTMIQWGQVTSGATLNPFSLTFPVAFPTACTAFVWMCNSIGYGAYTARSTTGATIALGGASTDNGNCIAIGY